MIDLIQKRSLSLEDLQQEVLVLRKEQFKQRMTKANGLLTKPHVVAETRRNIARIKTIISEKVRSSS